jgi:oligopeptide/dipeptide ABC transporter ATP-binding protein
MSMHINLITMSTPVIEVRGLSKSFTVRKLFGASRSVAAARDVSFCVDRGQAVALVGESGSGKSTIARIVLRLEPPDRGEIRLDGEDVLTREPRRASLAYRARVQMVFQDPFASLNPAHPVAHHLIRPLLRHGRATARDAREKAIELLHTVGLDPAGDFIDRHPYELSGGQRQRVAIARALAVEPDVLVADEPTSMLDVSIRMEVLNLLLKLKRERRLAILLITHDLASARYLADRIVVLFRGRVVEDGPADALVESPAHPYTRALLSSLAGIETSPSHAARSLVATEEDVGTGCPFVTRCPDALDRCRAEDPQPRSVNDRRVRCHLYPEDGHAPEGPV